MPINRMYGWRPGLPNPRYPQLRLQSFPALSLEKDLTTTGFMPPVWDQGQTSSCTGHGTTGGLMYVRAKQKLPFFDLSRLFPYYNARVAEKDPSQDAGAAIGDVVEASQQFGDCLYADLPTDPKLVTKAPSPQAYKNALVHKSISVTRVYGDTPESFQYHVKHCIDVLGVPVIVGFTLYNSFESDETAKTGIVPMPKAGDQVVGGHCMLAVGYSDKTQLVTIRNSWGADWGQAGYCQMPYSYVFNTDYADDFHAILSVNQ